MATGATILDRAERTLDFDRTSVAVPGLESAALLAIANDAVLQYHASFEKTGEPSSILKKETGYTLVADTALNGALASGATSIVGDSFASFGTSGAIAIWDNDDVDYAEFGANNLTTTLSTVTGVNFAHEDNDTVSLLYALPSNFKTMRSQEGVEDGVTVDGTPYFFTSGIPVGNKYAIYDNGTTKYLHFPRGLTGDVFVHYNAAPTTVDDEADTIDIPEVDIWFPVWKVVEYAAPKLERTDYYQIAKNNAFDILHSAHQRRSIGKRPRLRPMKRSTGIRRSAIFD